MIEQEEILKIGVIGLKFAPHVSVFGHLARQSSAAMIIEESDSETELCGIFERSIKFMLNSHSRKFIQYKQWQRKI
jgi:hypothetical protein